MFRALFRSPRTILTSAKATSQVRGGQTIHLQRVRVRPRLVRLRNIAIGVGVTILCYRAYNGLVLSPLFDWLAREMEKISPEEREKLEDVEPLFIPLPFTTRMIDPLPYSGADPEWQEFIKLAKDNDMQMKLRTDMANLVRAVAENSALLVHRCGRDMKIRRWWLDTDYPYKPPPEFERSVIEISEEGWQIVDRPIDSSLVIRTSRILMPSPVLLSTWAFTGALMKQSLLDLARMIGYEPKSPTSLPQLPTPSNINPNPTLPKALQQLQQQATKRPDHVKDPRALAAHKRQTTYGSATPPGINPPPNSGGGDSGESSDGSSTPPSPQPRRTSGGQAASTLDGDKASEERFPGHETLRSLVSGPWAEAKRKFAQTWKPLRELPPKGCVFVSGLVELETSKAYIVIEVYGWWDPKSRKYDTKSVFMGLKRLQMKQQAPMR